MRKTLAIAALLVAAPFVQAEEGIITLDLTKSTTPLTFDADNGAWTDTYNDDETNIKSQCFDFVHGSIAEMSTWWGFTASNSANNERRTNYITYQFSNMPKGGIVLNEDGTIKKAENGAPVVSAEVPYFVGYYAPWAARRPVDMTFTDGKSYEPVGVYVTLNSYTYYTVEGGDSFCRPFSDGDKLTLTIHGVASDESEKEIVVNLCSVENGDLTIARGWKYVDLSSLGAVNEIYFTMKSTDTGDWGDNTPEYFCLDKLMVRPVNQSGISSVDANGNNLRYDSASLLAKADQDAFIGIYDVAGRMVASGEGSVDTSSLQAGVYVARSGNASVKFVR